MILGIAFLPDSARLVITMAFQLGATIIIFIATWLCKLTGSPAALTNLKGVEDQLQIITQ